MSSSPSLRSIVYVSTAVRALTEPELEALLVEARDLNLETHTTGVLLYSGGNFMQCFEGTDAAVAITYDRIRRSRRHRDIIELVDERVDERSFSDWQMGFRQVRTSELLAISSAQWQRQLAGAAGDARESAGLMLLKHFWAQAR